MGEAIPNIHNLRWLMVAGNVKEWKVILSHSNLMIFLVVCILIKLYGFEKNNLKNKTKSYSSLTIIC